MRKVTALCFLLIFTMSLSSCSEQPVTFTANAESSNVTPLPLDRMTGLLYNMETWNALTDADKLSAIKTVLEIYKTRENIAILKPIDFYAQLVTQSLRENPGFASLSLPRLIQILSVMEYDYYNGQNKDAVAREILGEKMYESNKQRIAEQGQQPAVGA